MPSFIDSPITLLLLVANLMVSGYALAADSTLIGRLAFEPKRILGNREYYRIVTAGFVHGNVPHLLFNLITLYFFGRFLEPVLGPGRFLIVYFGAEIAAHALTLWRHKDTPGYAAVGASGAISGVVFAFCLFRPFELLYVFFALPIPAWLFAIAFVGLSIGAMKRQEGRLGGGIAHEAHLGGAIGGLILTVLVKPASLSIFLGQIGL